LFQNDPLAGRFCLWWMSEQAYVALDRLAWRP
jgi:hypothetical protein